MKSRLSIAITTNSLSSIIYSMAIYFSFAIFVCVCPSPIPEHFYEAIFSSGPNPPPPPAPFVM